MKVAILGSTGAVGRECLEQALAAGHEVRVLVRTPSKLPSELRERVEVVEGDALNVGDIEKLLAGGIEAVLFAIGVDKYSPEDLCTDVTLHLLTTMPKKGVRRLVWCGGGSTIVKEDHVTFGARFVAVFASMFMGLRHRDKEHQYELLESNREIEWLGVRPLQLKKGERSGVYRTGFDAFNGLSSLTFADCADAMLKMLSDDTWLYKAPIVQY